jgi:chitinase
MLYLQKSHYLLAIFLTSVLGFLSTHATAQPPQELAVIGYYAGNGQDLERYRWEQLTHVIYSFCHLKGDELAVDNAQDSIAIRNLVAIKQAHPNLKVLLSLGGWGGCKTCSPVFSKPLGRANFAKSVKQLCDTYGTDGIDLDWEYPAIEGVPGHPYALEDRDNFTALVQELRNALGKSALVSFAAGGFKSYFDTSIDWDTVMPLVDYVNLMSYDIVGGYSKVTGHHTPLYSNMNQEGSADFGVQYLLKLGVPAQKIILGAAFYGRSWKEVAPEQNGLYQSGIFKSFIPHHRFEEVLSPERGFEFFRDSVSQAPYAYSTKEKEFATFDDPISLQQKTQYAIDHNLGGIMFWQLTDDRRDGRLLQSIWEVKKGN